MTQAYLSQSDGRVISANTDIIERLKRIETKVVRFAEEMGIDTDVNFDWITVDDEARILYVSTLGRSFSVMHKEALKRGATKRGKFYDIIFRGDVHGTLFL